MREIKLRAWHIEEKRMYPVLDIDLRPYNGVVEVEATIQEHNAYDGEGDWRKFGVAGKTIELMQYTGLKDKNGVDIYEGDVVHKECENGNIWAVSWAPFGLPEFMVYNQINSFRSFDLDDEGVLIVQICEGKIFEPLVIGNVWEPTELLKENHVT